MPSITSGSNATFTVLSGYTIDVQCPGGWVQLEYPVGTKVFEGSVGNGRTFGPYAGGLSAKLTSVRGDIYYETDQREAQDANFDPANVAITSGTVGGRTVADLAASARPTLSIYGPTNPLYIAHRGSAALYPEESAVAYARAFADGETALEADVQTLSGGALGVLHDSTVDRTTTGTGNVSTFTSSTFQALTMDSSVWLGSNYGDTLNPILFQTFIDSYKGKAILVPEDKDILSMTAMVRAMLNSGVPFDQALVQCFTASNLTTAVNAGYQALGLSGSGSPTAATIAATGAQWAAVAVGDSLSSYIAAGLKTLVWTVNRRYLRDQYLAQGASGFFSDDPTYLRRNTAISTTDFFSRQTWAPGMLASSADDGTNISYRGAFTAPNYWGYPSSADTAYNGCLQGYLCPVANPQNFMLQGNITMDAVNAGDLTRWASIFIGVTDQPYQDTSDTTAGYHFLMRMTGKLDAFKKVSGSGPVSLGGNTSSNLTQGAEYGFRLTVTPSTMTIAIFSGATQLNTLTVSDSTHRGGYIQLGRAGMACRFRSLQVS